MTSTPPYHPHHDPLPRLADELSAVSDRLTTIGAELRQWQRPATAPAAPYAVPPAQPPAFGPVPLQYPTPYPPAAPRPPYPSPAPPPTSPPWPMQTARVGGTPPGPPPPTLWERLGREGAGSRILAWVGAGVTLAGLVLLLVLAVQRGYIGPVPRLLLGGALSAALVGIGLALHRRPGGQIGGRAAAATGFAGLFLDVIATTAGYHFVPPAAGLGLGLAVAAAGVGVAHVWRSELLAGFVVLGCALSGPVLTGVHQPALLLGFLLVLQVATSPVHLGHRWGGLALVANVPPSLAVLALAAARIDGGTDAPVVAGLAVVVATVQLAVATLLASRQRHDIALGLALAAPVPVMVSAPLLAGTTAAVVLGGFGALLAALWTAQRTRALPVPDGFALAIGGGAVVTAVQAVCLGADGSGRALALLGGAVLLAVLAGTARYAAAAVAAAGVGGLGLMIALAESLRPEFVTVAPYGTVARSEVLAMGATGLLVAVAAVAFAWAAGRTVAAGDADGVRPIWITAGLAGLYGATAAVVSMGLAISPDERGFLAGHVGVTVSWTVAALVLLLRWTHSTPLRVTGLALVAAAVAKLVLFDLSSLSGIPRVLSFLGAGLVLLAAGARYASRTTVDDDEAAREPVQAGGSMYRS
ncbi:DUF2339 domain-containing protein [Jatrophihabitans fulvus]